jgi:CheY-like chemotaxis protein
MTKGTVLIVEDKEEFRKIYGDRLRFGGFDVLDAADGNQALDVLHSKHVDLIITDINMPHKNGYELIAEIKADEKLKHIPVVVMSVFDQSEHLDKARTLGAVDFLVKGVTTPNTVLEKIETLIVDSKK